jgi:hypothetical protein
MDLLVAHGATQANAVAKLADLERSSVRIDIHDEPDALRIRVYMPRDIISAQSTST